MKQKPDPNTREARREATSKARHGPNVFVDSGRRGGLAWAKRVRELTKLERAMKR